MRSFYILLLAIAVAAVSCRTKDGAPGPAGENTLTQQGYVSGKITFLDDSGRTVHTPFKYEYFESLKDNRFYIYDQGANSDYQIIVTRRSADDSYNNFNFQIAGTNNMIDGTESDPDYMQNSFSFVTIVNGTLYEFNSTNTVVTDLQLDTTTGRLTFDYTATVYTPNGLATVTGTVDVTLNRVYHSIMSEG